jgi:hypothetical protein
MYTGTMAEHCKEFAAFFKHKQIQTENKEIIKIF